MINISQNQFFILGIFLFLFLKLLFVFVSLLKNNTLKISKNFKALNSVMKFLFVIYIIFLISKVFFPISINFSNDQPFKYPAIWLNPITSLITVYTNNGPFGFTYQILGNFILLSPLSFFALYFNNNKFDSLKSVLILCFKVSLLIEFSQIFLSLSLPNVKRYFEINDLILNSLGSVIGYYSYVIFNYMYNLIFQNKLNI